MVIYLTWRKTALRMYGNEDITPKIQFNSPGIREIWDLIFL